MYLMTTPVRRATLPRHAVDLAVEDLPHEDATIEWWYVNGHLTDTEGNDYSIFAAFFRSAVDTNDDGSYRWGYALTWGLTSVSHRRYITECLVDPDSVQIGLDRLDRQIGPRDKRLRKAIREVLDSGDVILPDVRLKRRPIHSTDHLHLNLDDRQFESLGNNRYRLQLFHEEHAAGCELTFTLDKPVVLHGDNGYVRGSTLDEMFYYFCPRCSVTGCITHDGIRRDVASGSLWYDHEYGRGEDPENKAWEACWNWISTQLNNGWELTIYDVFDKHDGIQTDHVALLIDPDGKRHEYREFTFTGDQPWISARTFASYPTRWMIEIPDAEVSIQANATLPEQEFITYITKSPFWEGRVEVQGTMAGIRVHGPGYVERAGFNKIDSLEQFFDAVGEATRQSVREILPLPACADDMLRITASAEHAHYTADIDSKRFSDKVVQPIREIVDRGGKAWRSYCLLACCDAVGGNSQHYLPWLALPEMMHVGSLIIDDVQDESTTRRGGPTCHAVHGVPLAINAGNLSYFLPALAMQADNLTDNQRLQIYDQYFLCMRSAHVGQALDIAGQPELFARAAEQGDSDALEASVLATHRLKSAAPAASLARVGAILGGASDAQIHALGAYHEALGLAFQIMDDVLNLRGFDNGLKDRGEDITARKVTIPIALSMGALEPEARQQVYRAVCSGARDRTTIDQVVQLIEDSGTFELAEAQARRLVDEGWAEVAPRLRPSIYSVHLRAFGSFVLDRHY